ncbi:hypothetical protein OR1_01769 [Geobacter sp. OR-1]|uniref:hypothetical protein n=1 Tax=Geobacter sp. OR-1 TaxID=1266765 RepID=UPI0005421126|nr:hypothetical protein [Geobacter sp. OR-1]GAM09490.1 hypothetical protein OR1_01769 [Geobacter sp. OR-1]
MTPNMQSFVNHVAATLKSDPDIPQQLKELPDDQLNRFICKALEEMVYENSMAELTLKTVELVIQLARLQIQE